MHCELVVFVSFTPPQIRSEAKTGKFPSKDMARYNIFRKSTLLWALQNLIFWKNIAGVLRRVNLAGFIQVFPFEHMGKAAGLSRPASGPHEHFQSFRKDSPYGPKGPTPFSDRQLVEHLNGNIHYQMFCRKL